MRSSGLVNKMIIQTTSEQKCAKCGGTGTIRVGTVIAGNVKGLKVCRETMVTLEDDCDMCQGRGHNVISINKIKRKKKEVLDETPIRIC